MPDKRRTNSNEVRRTHTRAPASAPRESPTPPTDAANRDVGAQEFFSALTRSLDALQRQLANANNSFADFVVKEFKLETPLTLTMNTLGAVRFLLPDDNTRPELLTRMTMVLTPVAKAADALSAVEAEDQRVSDVTPITDTPAIPKEFVGALLERDIRTVGDFLGVMANARFSVELASILRVDREGLGRWADQIRLMDMGKLTAKQLDALATFKIASIPAVAALTPDRVKEISGKFPKELPDNFLFALVEQARARVPRAQVSARPGFGTSPVNVRPEPTPAAQAGRPPSTQPL